MPVLELHCQDKIKALLRAGINYQGDALKEHLKSQTEVPYWRIAWFGNDDITQKFWHVLSELQDELSPMYSTQGELYTELWKLFREVVLNKKEFQPREKLERKIHDFAAVVKKPLIEFYVIYEVKNIDIGSNDFTFGNVDVVRFNKTHLEIYNTIKNEFLKEWLADWDGEIVAKVEVNASGTDNANLTGRAEIEKVLSVLRLGIRKELIGRSSDSLFLWEIGNSLVIAKNDAGAPFSLFSNIENYPFVADIGKILTKILNEHSLWSRILNEELPKDIQIRIERAMEWISLAIKEPSIDHKLVHLCTALEVMLLPEHTSGKKGELIALRQVLLGQSVFQAPTSILHLYERRSDIIHGGHLNITTYEEYVHLLDCCLNVLTKIIALTDRFTNAVTLKELLDKVENKETLEGFIENCERGLIEGRKIEDIKKAATKLLEQYN